MNEYKKIELMDLIERYANKKFLCGVTADEKRTDRYKKEAEELESKIKDIIKKL